MRNDANFDPVDVAVIGAGIAGLSTAVYARLAGLSVRVFEKHYLPGGLCTAWKRKGYVFDYCYDYFMGSGKDQGFHEIWNELGVIDGREFQHIDSFGRYVGSDGRSLDLYTDPSRLREHLLAIAPEDAGMIGELCAGIRKMQRFVMSEFSLSWKGLPRLLRSLPALPTMLKWSRVSVLEWCSRLRNPFLREAFPPLIGFTDFPMSGPLMVFAMIHTDNAAYPLGGSLPVALAIERRAKDLGTEFAYRSAVKRVLVEGGGARGVELEDGRVQAARHVVAACDAHATFERLLEGKVKNPDYEAMFEKAEIAVSLVQVSLGVRPDPAWGLRDLPGAIQLPLGRPVIVDGRERTRVRIRQYANDPNMAPEGGTVLLARYEGDYARWKNLREDATAYKAEKARILTETIVALEERFPGIGSRVEASDIATPTSCERYTDNWRGSMGGWIVTTDLMKKCTAGWTFPKTFEGVAGFHLIGQWSEPGSGTPIAARNGRDVVRAILKVDRKKKYHR